MGDTNIFGGRGDNEIGITRLVTSRGGTPGVGDAGRGPEVQLLKLAGDSQVGRAVTVCMSSVRSPGLAGEGYEAGIITGIIRFGNGSGRSEIEFDLPCAETHDPFNANGNGMLFTVPAGNVELYAREDSLIIPKAGQGHPSDVGGALVTAFVTPGTLGAGSSLFRKTDIFAWNGLAASETSTRFRVPAFAATYLLIRNERNTSVDVILGDASGRIIDRYTIAVNEIHNTHTVAPRVSWIEVLNHGPGTIETGMLVYNIDYASEPFYGIPIDSAGVGDGDDGGGPGSDGDGPGRGPGSGGGGGPSMDPLPPPDPALFEDLSACKNDFIVSTGPPGGTFAIGGSLPSVVSPTEGPIPTAWIGQGFVTYFNSVYHVTMISTHDSTLHAEIWTGGLSGAGSQITDPATRGESFSNQALVHGAVMPNTTDILQINSRRVKRWKASTQTWINHSNTPSYLDFPALLAPVTPLMCTYKSSAVFATASGRAAFWSESSGWIRLADLPALGDGCNCYEAVRMSNGNIFVMRAKQRVNFHYPACFVYDHVTNTWITTPPVPNGVASWGVTCNCLSGSKILIAGGFDPNNTDTYPMLPDGNPDRSVNISNAHTSAAVYDGVTNSWTTVDSLNIKRGWHTGVSLPDGRVMIIGGTNTAFTHGGLMPYASTEFYNPLSQAFSSGPNLIQGRQSLPNGNDNDLFAMRSVVAPGHPFRVLVFGGSVASTYNPGTLTLAIDTEVLV